MLQNCSWEGPLPAGLAACTALVHLALMDSQFDGPIPSSWAAHKELVEINLSRNRLTGPIPSSYGQSLASLQLSGNALTGQIPAEFAKLGSLKRGGVLFAAVDVSRNRITHALTAPEIEMFHDYGCVSIMCHDTLIHRSLTRFLLPTQPESHSPGQRHHDLDCDRGARYQAAEQFDVSWEAAIAGAAAPDPQPPNSGRL